jgi:large subunit ribosomal protein L31
MKAGIHPTFMECVVTCGCGNSFTTISTQPEMRVEICSSCHPFYTGKEKFVDTAGRVQKFEQRFKWSAEQAAERSKQKAAQQKKKPKIRREPLKATKKKKQPAAAPIEPGEANAAAAPVEPAEANAAPPDQPAAAPDAPAEPPAAAEPGATTPPAPESGDTPTSS